MTVPPFSMLRKFLENNPHRLGTTPRNVWAGPRALLPVPRKAAPSWDRDHSNTKHPKPWSHADRERCQGVFSKGTADGDWWLSAEKKFGVMAALLKAPDVENMKINFGDLFSLRKNVSIRLSLISFQLCILLWFFVGKENLPHQFCCNYICWGRDPNTPEGKQVNPKALRLMEDILHHLGCIIPYEYWDIYYINWCRISEPRASFPLLGWRTNSVVRSTSAETFQRMKDFGE